MESLRKLKVKTLDNQVYSLEVNPEILIKDLKAEIEKATKVPNDKQRLIFGGKMLIDDKPLSTYITEDDQVIHMLARTAQQEQQGEQSAPQNQQPTSTAQPNQQQQQQQPSNIPNPLGQGFVIRTATSLPPDIDVPLNNLLGNLIQATTGNVLPLGQTNQVITIRGPDGQISQRTIQMSHSQESIPLNIQQQNQNVQSQPQQNEQQMTSGTIPTTSGTGTTTTQQQQQATTTTTQSQTSTQHGHQQQVLIELPHQHVHHIGSIVNDLMGYNSSFPGPVMPPTGLPRNSLVMLGGFLYVYQFQMLRLIPFLSRLADLLQRESQMTSPQDRLQTQMLANQIGKALNEISLATTPVVDLFKNLTIGERPGEYIITQPRRNVQQPHTHTHIHTHQHPHPQQGSQMSMNAQPLGGMGFPMQMFPMNQGAQNINYVGLGMQGQQQQQQQAGPTTTATTTTTSQPVSQPQSSNEQQTQGGGSQQTQTDNIRGTSTIPQEQSNQIPQQQATQGPSDTGTMESSGRPQRVSMLRDYFIASGFSISKDAGEDFMELFGTVKFFDILPELMKNRWTFINQYRNELKEGYHRLLHKYGGDVHQVAGKLTSHILKLLEVPKQYEGKVMEGFEPTTVAGEILERKIAQVLQIIDSYTETPNTKFSDLLGAVIPDTLGEIVYEISEGLNNGYQDFKEIYSENIRIMLRETFRQADHMLEKPITELIWFNLENAYRFHVMKLQNAQKGELEKKLLQEIEQALNEDHDAQEDIEEKKLSQAYSKGSE